MSAIPGALSLSFAGFNFFFPVPLLAMERLDVPLTMEVSIIGLAFFILSISESSTPRGARKEGAVDL